MKFSIKDFFKKRDQIRMKKSLIENIIFLCSVGKDITFKKAGGADMDNSNKY